MNSQAFGSAPSHDDAAKHRFMQHKIAEAVSLNADVSSLILHLGERVVRWSMLSRFDTARDAQVLKPLMKQFDQGTH